MSRERVAGRLLALRARVATLEQERDEAARVGMALLMATGTAILVTTADEVRMPRADWDKIVEKAIAARRTIDPWAECRWTDLAASLSSAPMTEPTSCARVAGMADRPSGEDVERWQADPAVRAVVAEVERELREMVESYQFGDPLAVKVQARSLIEDRVQRLNAQPREDRIRVAWALMSGEPMLSSAEYAESYVSDAEFYVGSEDGESFIGIRAQSRAAIETVVVTAQIGVLDAPLCAVCGLTAGDARANHRPSLRSFFGPCNEGGYFPHEFKPRANV